MHAMHLHWHVQSRLPHYDAMRLPHWHVHGCHIITQQPCTCTGTASRSRSRLTNYEAMQHLHWHCQWHVHGCHIMTPCRTWHVHDYRDHIMTSGHNVHTVPRHSATNLNLLVHLQDAQVILDNIETNIPQYAIEY